ncbi:MAG: nuclease-related domain-containing protein [Anaerolineae bacterium]
MRVYDNEKFIQRRAWLGKWGSLGGMGVLLLGLVISFNPNYFYISFGCLILGFVLSQMGTYNAARFTRTPRQHERLERTLKGLDDRYALFNYLLPAAHVLLGPHGIIVFRLKDQSGEIQCTGERWKQKLTVGRVLTAFGSEGLGNPTRDVEDEAQTLQRFLEKHEIPTENVPIRGVVLFLNPNAKLLLENPTVPVLTAKQVKQFLREPDRRRQFKATERKVLLARLEQLLGLAPSRAVEEEGEEA